MHVMTSKAESSYTIRCMIRGYHVYKNFWSSYTGEVLHVCTVAIMKKSVEGPFRSGTAVKQHQNIYTLRVLVKRYTVG